jgi:hypothetical protein
LEQVFLTLNAPVVLWSIFTAAILAVVIDYLFPVDWVAYFGYALFAVFIGATVPVAPIVSFVTILVVFGVMLVLHKMFFANYLTNAPYCYRHPESKNPSTER